MAQADERPRGDPWHAFGYLVAGVMLYGSIGWLLDRWWGTGFMVAIGILLGAVLGLYLTWTRFRIPEDREDPEDAVAHPQQTTTDTDGPEPDEPDEQATQT
ncbi:MAG: hypothetical protein CMH83_03400 [Nocardioides sp.]|nr:hypothetical protein [Nocardioides sp.]